MRPTTGTGRAFISMYVPMSISLVSNVPGHEGQYNFISEVCHQRMVDDMEACLWGMLDAAYRLVLNTMDPYWSQLDNLVFRQGREIECTWDHEDSEDAEITVDHMVAMGTGARTLAKMAALQKQCNIYKWVKLDMLKNGPSLFSIGMHYDMRGSRGLFHTFKPELADFAELINMAIIGGPSMFKRLTEFGHTTIWMSYYGDKALPYRSLVSFDANSLYP